MKGLSQRIVDFIATLEPSYTRQLADGRDCALSLADGTLLMPLDESHASTEEGWVAVLWQGDGQRRSEVPGSLLASRAILQHVALLGFLLAQRNHAVAQVAGGKHVEVFAQAAGGAAVVGDGDDGGEIADEAGKVVRAGLGGRGGCVALEAAEERGEAGASADGDDTEACGLGEDWHRDSV